jgi:hypothetical protein
VIDNVETLNTGSFGVTITDNDISAIVVTESGTPASTDVAEGGATDTYNVRLATHPYDDITVTVDPDAQCDVGNGAGVAKTLTVLADNWNVDQTVTVTAVNDLVIELGTQNCTITHAAASVDDEKYDGLAGPGVVGNITDDDFPRVMITTSTGNSVDEAAPSTTDSYTVELYRPPDADVTVNITVTDGQTKIGEGAGTPASSLALVFTPDDWNQPRTVTIHVVDDFVDEDNTHTGAIGHAVVSTATGYSTVPEIWVDNAQDADGAMSVSIGDNDTAGVTVAPTGGSLQTTEAGGADTFTVVLTSQPLQPVAIGISSSDTTEGTADKDHLDFDASNWSVAQTVTFTGVDDAIDDDDVDYTALTAAASSDDPKYDGMAVDDVAASNADDDTAGVRAGPPRSPWSSTRNRWRT